MNGSGPLEAARLCWICPRDARQPAVWLQQLDEADWFTPLCDEHVRDMDRVSHRYRYYRVGQEPRPPVHDPILMEL